MNEQERYLFRHTATRDTGAAFTATREGSGLARISPITEAARLWLHDNVGDEEVTRLGDDVMVEMRYFAVLADAIMAAGFTFERDALPN